MATNSKNDPAAVDAYLATLPARERETLQRLRTLIEETLPHVEERISYGTTVMFSLGRDLVGFVSQSEHLSFFTASPALTQAMKRDIGKPHRVSGATIHFSPEHPLPAALVKKILRASVRENQTDGKNGRAARSMTEHLKQWRHSSSRLDRDSSQ
jgi:uncharacterized protein YdhG (YjbR/CyaY superfamily)